MHKRLSVFVLLAGLCLTGCAPVLIGSGIAGGIVWERVRIRVGAFGDRLSSERILTEIKRHLPQK